MIVYICLIIIGTLTGAPSPYYFLCAVGLTLRLMLYCTAVFGDWGDDDIC